MIEFDLLIVGELNVDLIMANDDPRPLFGQREKFYSDMALEMGGASAIMACGTQKLNLDTVISGKIGEDAFGHLIIDNLNKNGVSVEGVITDPTTKTGITVHLSSPNDRAMLTYAGSMSEFSADEVPRSLVDRSHHLHVSSYFLQSKLQEGLPRLFRYARESGLTTSLDPGWDPSGNWDLEDILPLLDVFLPNEKELWNVAQVNDTKIALEKLGAIVPTVCVKQGDRGATAIQKGLLVSDSGFVVEQVVDSTGAGDSFNAGFLYGFLHKKTIGESLRWGSICGSLVVQHMGGIAGQPKLDDVMTFLSEMKLEKK